MKTFFGEAFIPKETLEETGIKYPVKLEYYKDVNEENFIGGNKTKYGISIVQTEYVPNNTKIKTKNIKYLTNDEKEDEKILNIFKESQVTIINSEEVISDLGFYIKNKT